MTTLRARIERAAIADLERHPNTHYACHIWDAAAKAVGCPPKVAEPVVIAMLHDGRIVERDGGYGVGEGRA